VRRSRPDIIATEAPALSASRASLPVVIPPEAKMTLRGSSGSVALVARYRALLDQGPPSAADSDKSVEKASELPRKAERSNSWGPE
jgi:hypothetical protein